LGIQQEALNGNINEIDQLNDKKTVVNQSTDIDIDSIGNLFDNILA
jgi:hypothetical protein